VSEDEKEDKAYDAALTRRLLRYVRPYGTQVLFAIVLLVAGAALEMVGPWLTMVAIDQAIPAGDFGQLNRLAALFGASLLATFAFEYFQVVLTTWIGQRVMYDLRVEVFRHLQRLSLGFFDRNPVGRLMTRVTNDVETLNELFSSGVVTVFGDLFTVLFIVIAMLLLDWRLALVTLTVLPFVFAAAFVFRGLIRKASWDIRIRLARINAFLQERVSGIRVVQLFGRERDASRRFEEINRDHLVSNLQSITYYALFFPVVEVLTAVAFALILWYGGLNVLQGTMTVGLVAAFLQYARRFFRPIQDLSEKYNLLQGAVASSERIFRLLDTPPDIEDPADPLPLPTPARGEIEFRDVWFHYPVPPEANYEAEPEWVLRGVSFRVAPGERVAIVGATGSGKSTIINLLMRFYEAQRGEILFDGVPINRVSTRQLRQRIGLVLQDVFLFSEDAAANIAFGIPDASREQVEQAAGRSPVHRAPARRLRPASGGARGISLGRREAADRLREGSDNGPGGAGAGRGDQFGRCRTGIADRGGARGADARTFQPRGRSPTVDGAAGRPDPGAEEGRDPGARYARRAPAAGGHLQSAPRAAVCFARWGGGWKNRPSSHRQERLKGGRTVTCDCRWLASCPRCRC
jgi:ATP-binding cassette subfamily B multidrug efflux pump